MANYVAHYRKKLYSLARKKLDLNRLLERHATEQEVAMAAEAVRESQLRALEAERAQVPPREANASRLRAIDEGIASCQRLTVSDIIASCQMAHAKSKGE
jgi:hypothetical protein